MEESRTGQKRIQLQPVVSEVSKEEGGILPVCPTQLYHSRSCCDQGTSQEAMGLQQGETTCRLHVLSAFDPVLRLAHRIRNEEEMPSEEGKQVGIEMEDRRFMASGCEEVSGEREGNPNPVRKSVGMHLEAFRTWEESKMKNYARWDGVYWFTSLWKLQETCAA